MKVLNKPFTVDFGAVNLKSLILTNDIERYEQIQAQGKIGVLFEPVVLGNANTYETNPFYLVGIQEDK